MPRVHSHHAASPGSDGHAHVSLDAELVGASFLSVERRTFVAILKRRLQRARRFRSVPVAFAFFALFLAAILLRRGAISATFDFEKKCGRARPLHARRRRRRLTALPSPAAS